ncbi:cysteine hydrolase [Dactylosporangium vinaceum]|uniref:Cysteine hydrolase family protein n=1 Tax=Dactylosporangium vinaceum TaxID=53362 RepID=A0ABV5MHR8_9ACTN|nr:isochorismatase family cysteine hydrolase [Dactylosporangium vinaceum]UAB99142.1 cysteine hydrolase [Dactylosporangium vinaceum]
MSVEPAALAADPWTRPEWDRAALLTIDTQVDFVEGGASPIPGTAAVVPTIARLLEAFRAAERPIIHVIRLYSGDDIDLPRRTLLASGAPVVRPGSPGSQLAPPLRPPGAPELDAGKLLAGEFQPLGPAEWAMWKPRWGAFHRTGLDGFLRGLGVSTVVVAGCNFPNCPRAAVLGASERDYRVVVAADAISGVDGRHLEEAARLGALHAPAEVIAASI